MDRRLVWVVGSCLAFVGFASVMTGGIGTAAADPTAPDVVLSSGDLLNPLGFETDLVPHGFESQWQVSVRNTGTGALAAGAQVTITLSVGFALGASGVHAGVGDGVAGTALTCTGAAPTWSCALPALVAGGGTSLGVNVTTSPGATLGTGGIVAATVAAAPIGDPSPADNTATHALTVGPVADLRYNVTTSSPPFLIGHRISATIAVRNAGPDPAEHVTIGVSLEGADITVVQADEGDVQPPIDPGDTIQRVFYTPTSIASGQTVTFTITFTASNATPNERVDASTTGIGVGTTFDAAYRCAPVQHCDGDGVSFVIAAPTTAASSPGDLAATGSATADELILATALIGIGMMLCFGARARR